MLLASIEYFCLTYSARTCFGSFWKAIGFDNAIFQDMESFGKRSFQMAMEKFCIFVWEILKYSKVDKTLCCMKNCIYCACLFSYL